MKLSVTLTLLFGTLVLSAPITQYPGFNTTQGVGFALSGSGGRIAQQVALSQLLINGTYPNGTSIIPSYLSGVSSGALALVGLNAILENIASSGAAGWNFGQFNDFVVTLSNDKVYRGGIRGVIDAIGNLDDGYIVDNSPLVDTINNALSTIGYSTLGDLFLPSYITTIDQVTGRNVRLLSTDPSVAGLPLIDVLLATTAIPVAFQPRTIEQLDPNGIYIDGGAGIDYLPVIPLLNGNLTVSTIYAITPNRDEGESPDRSQIEEQNVIRNALRTYEIQGKNLEIGAFSILSNSNVTSFLYAGTFNRTFSTLDFEQEQLQFDLAKEYGTNNAPVPITEDFAYSTFSNEVPQAAAERKRSVLPRENQIKARRSPKVYEVDILA